MNLSQMLKEMPLLAVLRHITPSDVMAISDVLVEAGFLCLEIPMNSPHPCESIQKISKAYGDRVLVGAGTVVTLEQVQQVADAGGKIIIMPHTDVRIIEKAKKLNLYCVPGVCTPSEAYSALHAGADALKLFPAEGISPAVLKSMCAILPKNLALIPTGGIIPEKMAPYRAAGASGFGLGSALYKPGDTPVQVAKQAKIFVAMMKTLL